jgi:hypothetical protein
MDYRTHHLSNVRPPAPAFAVNNQPIKQWLCLDIAVLKVVLSLLIDIMLGIDELLA